MGRMRHMRPSLYHQMTVASVYFRYVFLRTGQKYWAALTMSVYMFITESVRNGCLRSVATRMTSIQWLSLTSALRYSSVPETTVSAKYCPIIWEFLKLIDTFKVWDRRTLNETNPKPVGILSGHIDGITYIDSKGDGRHLITNSKDQSIKLWDMRCFSPQIGFEATRNAVSKQNWDYRWQAIPRKRKSIDLSSNESNFY